jgi:bacterioferritin-associated ferredoxin
MYICHCNDVSQTDLIEELKKNNGDMLNALAETGVAMCCGRCAETVEELFGIDRSKLFEYYTRRFNQQQ